ncbi:MULTISPECIES: LysE family transporter [unclassified Aureimonas]|uniref:LysE family transporter n=1 Tax=unclassified Aureimonas TaxID=2615206 RepID=UPI00070066EE|nr:MULTISPECIES: LysE family transporter [unclassified Aureimonas]KQT52625.1 lysine transporter LysE [Aureimonas sp. Leaf427]KQT77476.1 lysine transporter LysE [Aureimonas sp. Leaf460]
MSPYLLELATLMAVFSVGIVAPGADLAMVMRQSLTHGRRAAIWTSFGIGSALLFHVGYTVLGIGLIVSQSIVAFNIVKWCGAAYLFYLGWRSLRDASLPELPAIDTAERDRPMPAAKAFGMGFLTNALNPKPVVFFLTLFTSLVSLETPMVVKIGYGVVMASALILWFVGVSYFLTVPAVRDRFLRAGRWIGRVTGVVFIGLGLKLATERMHG